MKKALVSALLVSLAAGCGVSPGTKVSGTGMTAQSAQVSVDAKLISQLKLRAQDARKPQPKWKKVVAGRALTDQEKGGSYSDLLKVAFAEGQSHKGAGLIEASADNFSPSLTMSSAGSLDAMFLPSGKLGGIIEVVAADGKVTTYDWGLKETAMFLLMKGQTGEPLMDVKTVDQVQSLSSLLTKANMLPMPAGIDQVCAYLNNMPRRKPDLSVEWFPAYLAVTYQGHYAQGKMVANAITGDIYSPKP